jgi:hypothetical protein
VIIAKAGKPVTRLAPLEPRKERRKLGTLAGRLPVPDDFDDPLPDDIVADFEGHHRDPFDRVIVAQASVEPVHLYTVDRKLVPYSPLVGVI